MDEILYALWGDDMELWKPDNATAPYFAEYPTYTRPNNPCEHCANNPKNNPASSGFCHCVLGTVTTFTTFEVE